MKVREMSNSSSSPLGILATALLLFTGMLFQLGTVAQEEAEGFVTTTIPDEKKGGLTCPPNYDWENEGHVNCVRIIDGDSTWSTDPICPSPLVYAFESCMALEDATKKETNYYILTSLLSVGITTGLIWLMPSLKALIAAIVGMFALMILITVIYLRAYGNKPTFLSLKRNEVTAAEYNFQFLVVNWIFATAFIFVGEMIGEVITG
jgi:hypothetical protein